VDDRNGHRADDHSVQLVSRCTRSGYSIGGTLSGLAAGATVSLNDNGAEKRRREVYVSQKLQAPASPQVRGVSVCA
jgi:hypothetical protein